MYNLNDIGRFLNDRNRLYFFLNCFSFFQINKPEDNFRLNGSSSRAAVYRGVIDQ